MTCRVCFYAWFLTQKMGMSEDDKRNCCLVEIQETEAKYYKTLEDIDKVGGEREKKRERQRE